LLPTEEALLLPRTLAGLGVAERLAELGFADRRSYLTARYVGKHVAEVEIGRELLGHPAVWSIRAGLRALGIRRRYRVHHPERPQPVGHLEDGTPYDRLTVMVARLSPDVAAYLREHYGGDLLSLSEGVVCAVAFPTRTIDGVEAR
jgi:hypothetical protein